MNHALNRCSRDRLKKIVNILSTVTYCMYFLICSEINSFRNFHTVFHTIPQCGKVKKLLICERFLQNHVKSTYLSTNRTVVNCFHKIFSVFFCFHEIISEFNTNHILTPNSFYVVLTVFYV